MQTTPKANNILGHFFALFGAVVMLAIATWVTASTSEQVQPLDNLAVPRTGHTATALSDGRILITGGRDTDGNLVAAAEIFDPETQTSSASATLNTARVDHSATVLADGRVLVAGGTGASGALSSAEIFDPANAGAGFQAVASPMTSARTHHTATLLNNGTVLIAGGETGGTAEIFDPTTQSFTPTLWNLQVARNGHTATLFTDDSVLLAGGNTASLEMFTPLDQKFTLDAATLSVIRTGHWAFELSDTRLLLFQGDTGNSIDEFNPTTDTLTPKGSLNFHASSSSLLANGKVLVLGTDVSGLYNPDAVPPAPDFTAFDETGVPHSGILPRSGQSSTQLPGDKKILVAGGANTQNIFQGMALFNPARIWTDRDDYHPGDPVVLSGSGWKANEDVYLYAVDDETQQWTYGSTETAGADGSFVDSPYFIVLQRQLGATFTVTAVGAQSSMQADVEFTDAASITFTTLTVGAQSGTLTYGTAGSATYVVTVNRSSNGSASASLSITGLPTGATGTFSPASVSFSGNNPSATSTLTITTTSLTPAGTPAFTVKATDGNDVTNFVTGSGTLTIGPKHITGSFTAQSKVYDGLTTATVLTRSVSGLVGADVVTLSGGTATFNNRNVGSGKTVTLTGATLSGPDASKYVLDSVSTTTANITPLSITGSFTANSKQYDGTNSATVAARSLSGVIPPDAVTLTGGTATFNNKNVGTGKTVTLTGASLSGTDAGNYALGSVSTTTADITPKTLTISGAVANSKQYDGSATATVNFTGASLVGVIPPDVVNINSAGYSASFNNKNVGTAKPVTLTGVALSGTDAGNYTVTQPSGLTADITAKNLTISAAIADSKQYDGNAIATLDFTGALLVGVILPDVVTINSSGYNATFNNKDVGNSKPVTVTAVTLLGADAGNYTLSQPSGLTANITAKNLTITGATANNKQYDGNNSVTVNFAGASLVGVIAFDVVSIDSFGYSATFNNKNVGTAKAVTVIGVALSGTDAGNYTVSQPSGLAADITAKHVIGMFTAGNKPYDGNTTATVGFRIVNGPISGDAVSLTGGTATFDNKNVGTGKTVTLIGATLTGADAGNYVLDSVNTTTADITALHITGNFTANNKVYDGTAGATVSSRSLNGVIGGDAVSLTGGTATFSDKNVGNGKTLTLTGASLTGTGAGNYVLDSVSTTTADITAHALTVTATGIDKEYDGNTTASVTLTTDKISGDVVTANYTAASFADKNVSTNKSVSVSGISISGTDAGNYNLTNTTASTTANITARALTVTAHGVDREYDGTTIASVTLTTDKITGDVVTAAYTAASFADKNVGTNKSVSVTGISISGTDAVNYSLVNTTASTTANITTRALTVTAHGVDREYDGTTIASVTLTTDKISDDVVTAAYTAASFADKNVGTNKSVSVTGISISGTDAVNYSLVNTTASTTANITTRALTVTAHGVDREYDGTTIASVTLSTDKITGDVVTAAYTAASFADKNVGANKSVSVTGISISGADAGNYNLTNTTASTTANITARALTVTAHGVDKEYDSTTTATVTLTTDKITGDVVTTAYTAASFADKNVGNGKTVSVIGISIGGTDAGNYNLLNTTATTTANITARGLTVTAHGVNKVYDGTTTAAVTLTTDELTGDVITASYASASFPDKNVGNGKTVSVTGISIGGTDVGNYNLLNTTASTTADITGRALTVSATGINKIYDGTTTATVTLSDDRVSGDVFTDSYTSASFADKNVGIAKAVSVTGISISGTDAGNYNLVNTTASTTADITVRALTVTAHGVDRAYDGTATALVTLSTDKISGDVVTASYTAASFADKNVGTNKSVSVIGIAIGGSDAGNYNLVNTTASTTANITVLHITGTFTAANKVYDGNNSSMVLTRSLVGAISGDAVSLTGGSATFNDKNVGMGKTVTLAGATLSGADSGNYILDSVATTTADITARNLTITAATNTKPYDTNTSAAATPTVSGLQGSDTVTGLSETYDNKNVGTGKTLSVATYMVNDGNSGNNYVVSTVTNNTGVVTAVTLTITAVTNTKPYDANTSAAAVPTVSGLQGSDTVTGLSEAYANKNVGTGKTLSVATYMVNDGNSGNNYVVSTVTNNTGVVTAVTLTITAVTNTKTYDCNTTAAAMPTVSGLQPGDTVTGKVEAYATANAGTGKTLNVTAYTVNDGNGGTNYIVTTVPNTTGVVNKANTTTSVTSSPNPSVIGQIVTFTATVTPPTPCTPGGSVQFYDGAALLGTGTLNGLNPNSATFSTSSLTAGSHSITATYVGDSNFNPSTSSASTQNVNYTFIGFLPPIDNPPVLNQVKAGQVIPVKWQLKNSSGAIICDLSTLVVMQSISIGCDSHDPIDDIEEVVPPGGTVFRCDGTQFIFNWQTPKSWAGTCRQLQVTLSDGHTYIANFKFK